MPPPSCRTSWHSGLPFRHRHLLAQPLRGNWNVVGRTVAWLAAVPKVEVKLASQKSLCNVPKATSDRSDRQTAAARWALISAALKMNVVRLLSATILWTLSGQAVY